MHANQIVHDHGSRKKALVAKMMAAESGGSSSSTSGSERIKDRADAIAALRRRGSVK